MISISFANSLLIELKPKTYKVFLHNDDSLVPKWIENPGFPLKDFYEGREVEFVRLDFGSYFLDIYRDGIEVSTLTELNIRLINELEKRDYKVKVIHQ